MYSADLGKFFSLIDKCLCFSSLMPFSVSANYSPCRLLAANRSAFFLHTLPAPQFLERFCACEDLCTHVYEDYTRELAQKKAQSERNRGR